MTTGPVDIEQVIDGARLGPLHWRVLALCGLVTLLDGYDIQAMASATPSLAADWHVQPGDLRWIITAALIGIAASALLVSPLGDYFGRRAVLLSSFAVVGIATLLAATADTPDELFAWRFVTGIGLGASLPNALALTAEYRADAQPHTLVALMACGISLGAATSGFLAPLVIEYGGWRAVFVTGGIVAVLAWLPLFALPESLRFLVARRRDPRLIGRLLERLDDRSHRHAGVRLSSLRSRPRRQAVGQLAADAATRAGNPAVVARVLPESRPALPAVELAADAVEGERPALGAVSLRIAAMFQIGGVVGGFGLAWLMQRWGPYHRAECQLCADGRSTRDARDGNPATRLHHSC